MMSTERGPREDPAYSFLDLDDCPTDERERILTILHGPPPEPPPPPPQQQSLQAPATPTAAATSDKQQPVPQYTAAQQGQQQQQQPYVYINNVTANVNVHHPALPSSKQAGDEQQLPPQVAGSQAQQHQAVVATQSPMSTPATPVPTSATAVTVGPSMQQQQQQSIPPPAHAMLLPHQMAPFNAAPHPFMPGVSAASGPTGQFLPMVSQATLVSKPPNSGGGGAIPQSPGAAAGFYPANFAGVPPPPVMMATAQQRMRAPVSTGGTGPTAHAAAAAAAQYQQQAQQTALFHFYNQQLINQLTGGQPATLGHAQMAAIAQAQSLAVAQQQHQQVMQHMQTPPPSSSTAAAAQMQSPPPMPLGASSANLHMLSSPLPPPLPQLQLQQPPVVPPVVQSPPQHQQQQTTPHPHHHQPDVSSPPPSVPPPQQPQDEEKDHVVLEVEEVDAEEEIEQREQEIDPPEVEEHHSKEDLVGQLDEKLTIAEAEKPEVVEEAAEPAASVSPTAAAATPEPAAPKSWASLFKREGAGGDVVAGAGPGAHAAGGPGSGDPSRKPMAMIQPYNPKASPKSGAAGADSDDVVTTRDMELADMLKSYQLNHRASVIKPRGLSNRSNWCFVNAILQALLACPPFYNLMKSVPRDLLYGVDTSAGVEHQGGGTNMKILAAVHSFFAEFAPLENFPKLNNKRRKNGGLPQGQILEPASIYNYLLNSLSPTDTFKVIEGRQEDAEEFLTFLLNGLNDEMVALFKSVDKQPPQAENGGGEGGGGDVNTDEEDEWQEVGPKNKSVVTRRGAQGNLKAKPPLAEIFQGQMRSCLQPVNGEPTATLQPFFSLQLDIQSGDIKNVNEALVNNFATEMIDGYVCPKTKQAVEASKSMSLEELPPILVLHLKRFVYDGSGKGSGKLLKNIDFPVDLEISSKILSSATKAKYLPVKARTYKLFAVVYHNGTEATKGHYVTDIYHTGLATWIRCDDSILKAMNESMVLAHSANSVPYILFYRRGDTMTSSSAKQ